MKELEFEGGFAIGRSFPVADDMAALLISDFNIEICFAQRDAIALRKLQ